MIFLLWAMAANCITSASRKEMKAEQAFQKVLAPTLRMFLTASPELLRCQGVTRNGTACTAWAMEGGDLGRLSRSQAASADLPNTSHRKNRCPNGALTWGNSLLSQ